MTKNDQYDQNYSCGHITARISNEFFYPSQAKTEDGDNNKNKKKNRKRSIAINATSLYLIM